LGVAAAIYYTSIIDKRLFPLSVNVESIGEGRSIDKIVYITCALTVATATVTQYSIIAAPGLLIAYSSLALQLYSNPTPSRFLPQLMAVFAVSPAIKQLTTGFYFGHGDLFQHVDIIEDLMIGGSLSAISYARYRDFSGLHVLSTAIGTVSDIGAYGSLLILGVIVSMSIIPLMYLFGYYLTEDTWYATSAALAVTMMAQVSFYSSYFFTQSFASVLVLFLVVLTFTYNRVSKRWAITFLIVIISLTVIITHHLTQVVFLPMVLVPSTLYALNGRKYAARLLRSAQFRIYVLIGVLNLLYMAYFSDFLDNLLSKGTELITGGLTGGYSQVSTYAFGRAPPTGSVEVALDWLISPYGIYMIVLLAVFSLGVIAFLRSGPTNTAHRALIWAAILASPIVFETPISVKSLARIRYPWMFLFTLVIALGLYTACRRYAEQQPVKKVPLVLMLIVILGATAPLVTADHYYGLDPRTSTQNDFSEQEYESFRSLAGFVRTYDSERVTALQHTELALRRFDIPGEEVGYPNVRRGDLYLPAGLFVYRTQWSEYEVPFITSKEADDKLYSSRLYVSSSWLRQRVRTGNKVYDSGSVGMVWKSQDRPFEDM
jgi:hypothetical protein